MRSQVLFRRSRSLLKGPAACRPALFSAVRADSLLNRLKPSSPAANRVIVRLLSSSTSGPDATHSDIDVQPVPETPETPSDEPEKPKRRNRVLAATRELEPLPDELDILWTPDVNPSDLDPSHSSALPPPEILEEALNNLHIILHPQTQHRAIYASPVGPPTEPTFALFCPIEGGEYIIDATVRELACRTGSEVVVLDAVQLAAGEWGVFGKAANSLQLPRNPLHFLSSDPSHSPPTRPISMDEDEGEMVPQMITPSQMTLAVMTPLPMQGRALMTPSPRRNPTPSKVKIFFDELINVSNKSPVPSEMRSLPTPTKPRIIYIRDFPTLAPTSASWYPPLLSAVRQRRQGPLSRPTSPINNPMAIIFGMTSPLTPPTHLSSNTTGGMMSVFMNNSQQSSPPVPGSKPINSEWGEDDASDRARERRLRDRLRTWEKSDKALLDELPSLSSSSEVDRGSQRPDILVIGGPGIMSALPPIPGTGMNGNHGNRHGMPGSGTNSKFFRTSILIPNIRSLTMERACRVSRRREINELTMRMGVGAVGGILSDKNGTVQQSEHESGDKDQRTMWDDWGERVEEWSTVRQIADRAVGSVVTASALAGLSEKSTLDPTTIPWSAICRAWSAQKLSLDMRKAWTKQTAEMTLQEDDAETIVQHKVDEVVEKVKQDPDLDQHEHRLLPCIIDPASLPTTFSQVHLPSHTIDSVRTIVSLPLLHPSAFQQGILKTHGMNGLLLFGPPGTGKTLIVRALAKEAGCRMMAINPSDVLDMYLGEGEKLVRAVFSLARRLSPCVVFLDEIDTLFGARMSTQSAGALAHRGVITEFMQEMDGLKSSKDYRVVVIGATNRPFDLDDAVLRRLPRRLLVDLPGRTEREEILKILLHDETLAPDVDLKVLAKKTGTFSGSDLKHLCVSAALDAVKERMEVPWNTRVATVSDTSTPSVDLESSAHTSVQHPVTISDQASHSRILSLHNFNKALTEIVPSSSESLSSLTDLRKWNEEFGEGRNSRKSQQVWGRGRFGFIDYDEQREEGKVGMVENGSSRTGTRR